METASGDSAMPEASAEKKRPASAASNKEDSSEEKSEKSSRRSVTPEPAKKKKKIDPAQQMQTLFDFMRRYRREDGSDLCETFVRAPKRRTEPSYYEIVTDPIDMLRIQQKLKMDEYTNMEELKADFELLFKNALSYYKKGTQEFKDATEMGELFAKALEKVEAGEDPSVALGNREDSGEDEDLSETLEELFASVMTATDTADKDRLLHLMFRLLPSQKRYPEYYKTIEKPLDLKMIATKIVENKYTSTNELEEDVSIMCKNAQIFNEPGSIIYKDARVILKTIKQKNFELEAAKKARENRGTRARSRGPAQSRKQYAAEIANMSYEESESEEGSEGEEGIDKAQAEDPLWALFSFIRYFKTNKGDPLAEPFLTLPSKRELPDYYESIKNPISLNIIRKNLKAEKYGSDVEKLYKDMNKMFDNCKEYNRPESRLFKDANRLQKLLKNKYEDLDTESEEESSSESEPDSAVPTVVGTGNELSKKLRALYSDMIKFKNPQGIEYIEMFMERPSKKLYPDYYAVIKDPMDMKTINERIKADMYKTVEDFMQDVRLMFNNCRQYNEEGSEIVKDANTLEKRLYMKTKEMGIVTGPVGRMRKTNNPVNKKALPDKVKKLVDTVKEYKDPKGRQLSIIFMKLPNAKEFSEYYEVIKRPIDLDKIGSKVRSNSYNSLEECQSDLMLMFENACKFNEPDSQIYKDALTLQNVVKHAAKTLVEEDMDDTSVPNVIGAVQEILNHIFIEMYNQQDTDERCFSDSLAELPDHNVVDGKKVRALNLDLIKRRLDRGLYKRLDEFQRDIFVVLERARTLSRTDSQVFEDSAELQTHFIRIRDEACGHGEILQSRALMYTQSDLLKSVEKLKTIKQESEAPEEEEVKSNQDGQSSLTFNNMAYHVGDFVLAEVSSEKGALPSIFLIENIIKYGDEQMIYGNQFYRPRETFHVQTRKFLESEVFRTSEYKNVAFKDVIGRCCVMNVKDYFIKKPEGFEDFKTIFVCESRYSVKSRSFKKIKQFWNVPDHINLLLRDVALEPKRVQSIFRERVEKHKNELEELASMESTLESEIPPNILWETSELVPEAGEGSQYFEQYTIPGPITLRRGDAVYVRAENGKNLIAQIDSMWVASDGMAYFHGPWFVTPKETPHPASQMFYPREAFISTIQDTNPLLSVVGRCCILEMEDYVKSRPTQYSEENVHICENVYDESRRLIRSLPPTGLKRYEYNSTLVVADEVYYFKRNYKPSKETSAVQLPVVQGAGNTTLMDIDNEDSMDAPSVSSTDGAATPIIMSTPVSKKPQVTKPLSKSRLRTGYQIFSSQIWLRVKSEMTSGNFADISREIGNQWRNLTDGEKSHFEGKAKTMNEENARKAAEEAKLEEQNQAALSHNTSMHKVGKVENPAPMAGPSSGSAPNAPMKQVEPIFHTVPPRPQRLLHSEAYIRYIEGLTTESNTMSNWERQLKASKELVKCPDEARLPAHWLANNGEHGTSLDALWGLRDFLMCDSLGVQRIVQGPL